MKDYKLCYIEGAWAYFTDQSLDEQWGDDWDDAPYEHNAGEPYEHRGESIRKVAWEGDFDTPCTGQLNSSYCVKRINQCVVPWLCTPSWSSKPVVTIFAGVSFKEFTEKVKQGGGHVYMRAT